MACCFSELGLQCIDLFGELLGLGAIALKLSKLVRNLFIALGDVVLQYSHILSEHLSLLLIRLKRIRMLANLPFAIGQDVSEIGSMVFACPSSKRSSCLPPRVPK